MTISRLLAPRSIAVVGGGQWCANVLDQCRRFGFDGPLWHVHPTKSAFPHVTALPAAPDAVFIGVNRDATVETVQALSGIGAGGAICFASGFAEADAELGDGAEKQTALLDAAGDMTLLGPNCYGVLNALDQVALWPDQHGLVPVDRGVALITQSSNIAINLTMQARGLPIAYVITAGNQAQTSQASMAAAVLEDPRVTAVGLHIEGIGDLTGFELLAQRAHILGKPLVALKIGRSEAAQAATLSHTASLAGHHRGASALLRRLGIAEVRSLPVLLETLKLLHVHGPLATSDLACMSCSGGEASLAADAALGRGLRFPTLNDAQLTKLRKALGPKVALANPLDYHTYIWPDAVAMEATFTAMMQAELALGIVVLDFPRADRCDAAAWEHVITAVRRTQDVTGRPMSIVSSLAETMPEETAKRLVSLGIAPLNGLDEAFAAIEAAQMRAPTCGPVLAPRLPKQVRLLSEMDTKTALAAHGLAVPQRMTADGAENAAAAAQKIGFPVALKGQGIAHKTEAGAVILNLTDADAVAKAATAMPTETFLVEAMVPEAVAELLVGVTVDPAHGYMMTLAAGGTFTELLDDAVHLLLPTTETEIHIALRSLGIFPRLTGYRGGPAADLDAIVHAALCLQAYVLANPGRIAEVEVNPLMCLEKGAIAVDALARQGEPDD